MSTTDRDELARIVNEHQYDHVGMVCGCGMLCGLVCDGLTYSEHLADLLNAADRRKIDPDAETRTEKAEASLDRVRKLADNLAAHRKIASGSFPLALSEVERQIRAALDGVS